MRTDDSDFLIRTEGNNASKFFKMTKARTATILVMIICSCGLIFSITDAYPTSDSETSPEDPKLGSNNSRLVITHVVKTIEFEVGIIDDDGRVDENSTDSNASEFYETDIQLLNVDLLKEVLNQATADDDWEETTQPKQPTITNEENGQQAQNGSLLRSNQTTS